MFRAARCARQGTPSFHDLTDEHEGMVAGVRPAHRASGPSQGEAGWRAGAAGRSGNGAAGKVRAARRGSAIDLDDHHAKAGTLILEGLGRDRPFPFRVAGTAVTP